MDAMEDAAGTAAEEAYTAALEGGADPSAAASAAIEAAGAVMTEMGAPPEMVDTMANAAQDGFDSAIGSGMSPMEAFDAAGQSVDTAFGDGPPPGMEGDTPPPGMEGDMPPPGMEGDMPPPETYAPVMTMPADHLQVICLLRVVIFSVVICLLRVVTCLLQNTASSGW